MKINDWDRFIFENFKDESKFKMENYTDEYFKTIFIYLINSNKKIYISFEIFNSDGSKLRKIEFGSDEYICKGLFNPLMDENIEFLQKDWMENQGKQKQYELKYSDESAEKILNFLRVPLQVGWKEVHYFYKYKLYKVEILYVINDKRRSSKVLVQSFDEQDIPLPFDKFFNSIKVFLIDKLLEKKLVIKEINIFG